MCFYTYFIVLIFEEDGPEDFQDAGSMQSRFLELFMWNKPMPVTNIVNTFMENENELPFLQELSTICPRKDFFFGMNPRHMNAVSRLKDVIMGNVLLKLECILSPK